MARGNKTKGSNAPVGNTLASVYPAHSEMGRPSDNPASDFSAFVSLLSKLPEYEARICALEKELAAVKGASVEKPIVPKGRKWVTLKEAAAILGVSQKTVRRFLERKLLNRNAASRHILIPAEEVENFAKKVVL